MKLKRHIDFINADKHTDFINEDIDQYKDLFTALKKMIKEKAPFVTNITIDDREQTLNRLKFDDLELIGELPKEDDVFLNIRMKANVPVNETTIFWLIDKFVDSPTVKEVKIKSDHVFKFFIVSFRMEDLLDKDIFKSLKGIDKYKL